MNFFIKQHSTLPVLKYYLKEDMLSRHHITDDMFESVAVTFSMFNPLTKTFVIANKQADLHINDDRVQRGLKGEPKYMLVYRFSEKDTKNIGDYKAEFVVDFMGYYGCGKIKFPIGSGEDINVVVSESITKTTVV